MSKQENLFDNDSDGYDQEDVSGDEDDNYQRR